ncbi:MAG: fibronectin type III domain-containing protein, partial [Chloroflexota bacterium]|nr:fibronectin type III domain-containing protein [Chloroflexota bacterium]
SPDSPKVDEPVTLSAEALNAPPDSNASYNWEGNFGGSWISMGSEQTLSYLNGQPATALFRVTVSYDSGESTTSEPLSVTWTAPTPTPTPTPTATPLADPIFFPFALTRMVMERPGTLSGVTLPKAEGGEGEFAYSLTGLPPGLSFDPDTRTLSGAVAAGEYTLTYNATDEAGVQDALTFTLTVGPTSSEGGSGVQGQGGSAVRGRSTDGVSGQSEDISWRRPHVRNMAVGRKTYSEPSAPGFTVTWNAPDMSRDSSGDNLTLADIAQYEFRYGKVGHGLTMYGAASKDSRSVALTGLEPGTEYGVHLRVEYSGERFTEWSFANAEGRHTTNKVPKLAAGRLNPTYILEWGGNDSVQRIDDDFTDPNGDALTYTASSTPGGIVTATLEDVEENGNTVKKLRIHLLNPITGVANVTYGAHDGYGGYVFQVISVGGISNQTRDVAENSDAGASVGDPVAGTPYGTEALFYTLTGEASTSGAFEIDSSTGQISVKTGATLDHETKSSYTGKVKWTVNGQAAEVNLTINVTDENEPPLAPVNAEVAGITDTSLTVTWEAPDNTGRPAITGYKLEVQGLTTQNTNATTLSASYTSLTPGTTYTFTIRAINEEGDGAAATVSATTLDHRPRSADFTKHFRTGENAAFAQSDFPFTSDESTDVLANVKLTSRVDSRGGTSVVTTEGDFKLKQSDGTLGAAVAPDQLIAAADLDNLVFVPGATFDGTVIVRFKVIDAEGEESGDAYTLTLKQVANRPPAFGAGPLSREIAENSAGGTAVGAAVTADDPDTGDTLTYSLSGADASSFTIDSGTGQVSVASGTVLDFEAAKNTYTVVVGASDSKDSDGNADSVVDATITVNIAVTNLNEGIPPTVDFTITEIRATTMKVTVTPPDTVSTSPIIRYEVQYAKASTPALADGFVEIESGTSVTMTGLTPSTTYNVHVWARNMDDQISNPKTVKTVTTGPNTAPTSANFTKQVSRQTGATFSASDFPFTDADTGDALSKVKIVTLPGHTDIYGKTTGVLRFDGTAATAGQEVAADDLGKLKYVPQPNGFRVDIGGSFTFKVLDQAGSESPTYTVTLEQMADIVLSLSPDSITESATPTSGGRVTVTATLTGPTRSSAVTIPQIRVAIDHEARENSDYTVNTNSQSLTIPAGQKGASITFDFTGIEDFLVEGNELIEIYPTWVINLLTTTPTEWVEPVYLTLEDNDRAVVAITGPPGEVEEGEDA